MFWLMSSHRNGTDPNRWKCYSATTTPVLAKLIRSPAHLVRDFVRVRIRKLPQTRRAIAARVQGLARRFEQDEREPPEDL